MCRILPNSAVQPLGLAQQWTLDEEGNRVVKFCMTQDLSFSSNEHAMPTSVNKRIEMEHQKEGFGEVNVFSLLVTLILCQARRFGYMFADFML